MWQVDRQPGHRRGVSPRNSEHEAEKPQTAQASRSYSSTVALVWGMSNDPVCFARLYSGQTFQHILQVGTWLVTAPPGTLDHGVDHRAAFAGDRVKRGNGLQRAGGKFVVLVTLSRKHPNNGHGNNLDGWTLRTPAMARVARTVPLTPRAALMMRRVNKRSFSGRLVAGELAASRPSHGPAANRGLKLQHVNGCRAERLRRNR